MQIITITDRDGRLVRRAPPRSARPRDRHHRQRLPRAGAAVGGFSSTCRRRSIRIPRERYIVDAEEAPPEVIYETLMAPPVERIERRYSLDEVRYSPTAARAHAAASTSTPSISRPAPGRSRPTRRRSCRRSPMASTGRSSANPREVFLIEGHTDAVGNDVDNLSLSDRRAESVAIAADRSSSRCRRKT